MLYIRINLRQFYSKVNLLDLPASEAEALLLKSKKLNKFIHFNWQRSKVAICSYTFDAKSGNFPDAV